MRDRIKIIVDKLGRSTKTIIQDNCPLKENGICKLELIECNYGLTEIDVPDPVCPMSGKFEPEVVIKISVIKEKLE